jgi:hypothetical protein
LYKNKYLKYKNKYLSLKNQLGGNDSYYIGKYIKDIKDIKDIPDVSIDTQYTDLKKYSNIFI